MNNIEVRLGIIFTALTGAYIHPRLKNLLKIVLDDIDLIAAYPEYSKGRGIIIESELFRSNMVFLKSL